MEMSEEWEEAERLKRKELEPLVKEPEVDLEQDLLDTQRLQEILKKPKQLLSESDKIFLVAKTGHNPYDVHPLVNFSGIKKVASIFRAIRRGKASVDGTVFPRRPFNSRKPTRGRKINEIKKSLYGQYKNYLATN